jgi:hypothetical protein
MAVLQHWAAYFLGTWQRAVIISDSPTIELRPANMEYQHVDQTAHYDSSFGLCESSKYSYEQALELAHTIKVFV